MSHARAESKQSSSSSKSEGNESTNFGSSSTFPRGQEPLGRGGQALESHSVPVSSDHATVANQTSQRILEQGKIQAALSISQPDDPAEREAERVAEQVMRMSAAESPVDPGVAKGINRKGTSSQTVVLDEAEKQIQSVTAGGKPLSPATRSYFEPRFGRDFSDVRLHTGSKADEAARSINAEAFTHGTDMVFRGGMYNPGSKWGKELLAHELTHVVQQDDATARQPALHRQDDGETQTKSKSGTGAVGVAGVGQKASSGLIKKYKDWSKTELARDIVAVQYDSLLTLQEARIESWRKNLAIKDVKPGAVALKVALSVGATALGGVLGGVVSRSISGIASQVTQDLVSGATAKSAEMLLNAAGSEATELVKPDLAKASDAAGKVTGSSTTVTAESGTGDYYAEAMKILLERSKSKKASAFNKKSSQLSRPQLIVIRETLLQSAERLRQDPSKFMQTLSVGYMKLLDEIYLQQEASEYPGKSEAERRKKMYEESGTIDETSTRSGNLGLRGPISRSIGTWQDPDPEISHAIVSGINTETAKHLAGATIDDLPFSLSFRFWATPPGGQMGLAKVWFVRRPDGSIVVDLDESWAPDGEQLEEGREWLARYALEASRELSYGEIKNNAAEGAWKLYNQIKDREVPSNIMNLDMF